MTDRALLSMAQQFSGLPMGSLIGGPLNAAAKANAAMALTQTKFILDTGFAKKDATGSDPESYEPVMIKMSLTRSVITPGAPATQGNPTATPPVAAAPAQPASIQPVKTEFDLPILTIIPINSLGVDEVDINFEMEVKSSFAEDTSEKSEKSLAASSTFEASFGVGPFSAKISGSVSYDQKDSSTHDTHYQKSNSAKYNVHVHAGQLPVPKGVNTIIEAFAQSIQPISIDGSGKATEIK